MDSKPIIFPKGMSWFKRVDNAPENLKGKVCIKVDEFIKWLNDMDEYRSNNGWINLGLWKSKKTGELYFSLDTYKPKQDSELQALRDNHNENVERSSMEKSLEDLAF